MQRSLLALALLVLLLLPVHVAAAASLTVSTDKDTYQPGETVVITVVVEDNATSAAVGIAVYDPKGTLVYSDQLTVSIQNGTGTASTSFTLPDDAPSGNWLVRAQYGSVSAEDAFQVGESSSGGGSGSSSGFGGGNVLVGAAFIAMAFIALAISLNKSNSPSRGRGKR